MNHRGPHGTPRPFARYVCVIIVSAGIFWSAFLLSKLFSPLMVDRWLFINNINIPVAQVYQSIPKHTKACSAIGEDNNNDSNNALSVVLCLLVWSSFDTFGKCFSGFYEPGPRHVSLCSLSRLWTFLLRGDLFARRRKWRHLVLFLRVSKCFLMISWHGKLCSTSTFLNMCKPAIVKNFRPGSLFKDGTHALNIIDYAGTTCWRFLVWQLYVSRFFFVPYWSINW